jgi:hypothetical protein
MYFANNALLVLLLPAAVDSISFVVYCRLQKPRSWRG